MDPYAVLGVDPDASPTQIREAFRALVRRRHPDTASSPGQSPDINAVIEAYRILMDQAGRASLAAERVTDGTTEPPPRRRLPCPGCGGSGVSRTETTCRACAGSGEITELGNGRARHLVCSTCSGRGAGIRVVSCPRCGGDGLSPG